MPRRRDGPETASRSHSVLMSEPDDVGDVMLFDGNRGRANADAGVVHAALRQALADLRGNLILEISRVEALVSSSSGGSTLPVTGSVGPVGPLNGNSVKLRSQSFLSAGDEPKLPDLHTVINQSKLPEVPLVADQSKPRVVQMVDDEPEFEDPSKDAKFANGHDAVVEFEEFQGHPRNESAKGDVRAADQGGGGAVVVAKGSLDTCFSSKVYSVGLGDDAADRLGIVTMALQQEKAREVRPVTNGAEYLEEVSDDESISEVHSPGMVSTLSKDEHRARQQALNAHAKLMRATSRVSTLLPLSPTFMQNMTRSRYFEIFFAVMIVSNSFVLAAELEFQSHHLGEERFWAFILLSYIYNAIFVSEIVMRLSAEGFVHFFCKKNIGWALLDTTVAMVSFLELCLEIAVWSGGNVMTSEGLAGVNNVRIVRMVRVARVLRTFRAFQLIRFMVHLQTLLFSIFATLKSILWASVLMTSIIYVFAVTFTQCAIDGRLERSQADYDLHRMEYYWGSLDRSMGTLFQAISNGISWREAYELLNSISYLCGILFLIFIAFTYFVLLNVITGVFCNSAIEGAQKNPELIATSVVKQKKLQMETLKKLFDSVDIDGTGYMTIMEFEEMIQDDLANAHFQALGLNIGDAWTLFKLIDDDNSGTISIDEFLNGCEGLKGGARSIDVAALRHEANLANRKLLHAVTRIEGAVKPYIAMGKAKTSSFKAQKKSSKKNSSDLVRPASSPNLSNVHH